MSLSLVNSRSEPGASCSSGCFRAVDTNLTGNLVHLAFNIRRDSKLMSNSVMKKTSVCMERRH